MPGGPPRGGNSSPCLLFIASPRRTRAQLLTWDSAEKRRSLADCTGITMSGSDRLPDYPLSSDVVRRLRSALEAGDDEALRDVICSQVRPVDAVIELANDDWMKDPSAQLPPGVLVGNHSESPVCDSK